MGAAVSVGDLKHAVATAIGGHTDGKMQDQRTRTPKSILKLPDLEQSKSAVLNGLTSSSEREFLIGSPIKV